MDRMRVIEQLYRSREVSEALSKMQPEDLREDLKQECFMVLLEMPDERFTQLQNDNALKFFFVRTMLNMIRSSSSGFYRKFRNYQEFNKDLEDIKDQETVNAYPLLETLHWYERDMFLIYIRMDNNVRRVADFTKIPYMSCYKTIDYVRKKLKKSIKKNT